MKVFNVLDPNFQMQGHLFLEAAAGCGKTFAIEHIVARLLIEENIQFEECLIVTFTKAAALDLKKRIFETLLKIEKAVLLNDSSLLNLPYLEPLIADKGILIKVQQAIETCNFAMISTIHGFCMSFLTENAYFVDLPLSSEGEIELTELIKDALRALPKNLFPSIWLKQFANGTETLDDAIIRTIYPHLGLRLATEQKRSFGTFYEQFVQLFTELKKQLKAKDLLDFSECLVGFNGIYDREKKSKFEKEEKIFVEIFSSEKPSIRCFESFLESKSFIEKIEEANLSKKIDKQTELKAVCVDWIEKIAPFIDLIEKVLNFSNIVLNVLESVQDKLKETLDSNPLSHPDFLLKQMAKCVDKEEVQKILQKQYKAILIDEFQDTDPLQWKIFSKAFFYSSSIKLFACVGDPKQSIYGFRSADIATYLQAKQQFGEKSCYILDTNYRSEKGLIESLNDCFLSNQDSHFFYFNPSPYQIDYFPIRAKHEKLWDPQDKKSALHCLLSSGKTIKEIEEKTLFPYFAKEVRSLLKQGIQIDQIAFLVKDRFQANRLKTALEKSGIFFSSLKTDRIQDTASFTLILFIIEWLMNIDSSSTFKKILFHPYVRKEEFFDVAFVEMEFLKIKEKILDQISQNFSPFILPKILENIFTTFSPLENLLQQKDFQAYEELIQVKEFVLHLSFEVLSFTELFLKLEELKDVSFLENDRLKKRSSKNEKSPALITMHSSKGLEYDVVFVLGLYLETSQEALFYPIEEGLEKKWGCIKPCKPDLHQIPIDMEKMRQFYVAMTRAKKRVYFPIPVLEKPAKMNAPNQSPLLLFLKKQIWKTSDYDKLYYQDLSLEEIRKYLSCKSKGSFEEIFDDFQEEYEKNKEEKEFQDLPSFTPFCNPEEKRQIFSFSSLMQKKEEQKIQIEKKEAVGALFGVYFHELIEKMIENRWYDQTDTDEFKLWLKNALEFTSFSAQFTEIYEMLNLCMITPLFNGYALRDLPYQWIFPEAKLYLKITAEKELKGFMDLLVFVDGIYYIIDFKTNFLGEMEKDYHLHELNRVILSKEYHLQAACYMKSLAHYLKLIDQRPFEKIFGGVLFVFVRGLKFSQGIAKLNEIEELKKIFQHAIDTRS